MLALVWPPRIAAYYTNLRDFTPSNECAPSCLFYRGGEAPSIAPVVATLPLLGSAELEKLGDSAAFVSTKMLETNRRQSSIRVMTTMEREQSVPALLRF